MAVPNEEFDKPVLLIGGGEVDWALFESRAARGHALVAADGGANGLRSRGIVPELIVGDLDSLEDRGYWEERCRILEIAEQDTTDLEKCLLAVKAPAYIAFGFLGNRLDHSLAAVHLLAKYGGAKNLILVDTHDLIFAPPGSVELALEPDARVSILPLSPVTFKSSQGLEYPLDGLRIAPGVEIGVSNRATSGTVRIQTESPEQTKYALVLGNECLDAVLT